jgi:aminoglycoside phosphotransferase (APT) family kinase protein
MSAAGNVTERHRFDEAALANFLAAALPGFAGPLTVKQFQGGQSNPTYLLSTSARRYVLRTKPGPVARLLPSAHAIEREYRVMHALGGQGFPVPEVLLLVEDESIIGRAFYVMEHVDGRILWEPALPDLAPRERAALYDEMNRVIAALHAIDIDRAGLADYGKTGNYFERQFGRWSKQYRAAETEPIEAMDRLIEWLPRHLPAGEEVSVVHGDFRLDNLIFHPTEPRIIAVLDWELSTLGHPLADFSYHCMTWNIPATGFRGIGGLDFAALGIPTETEYVQRYCARAGREPIEHWNFYIAYNMFRLAAILQGVYKRATEVIAASDNALQHGRTARALAEIGWSKAQQA